MTQHHFDQEIHALEERIRRLALSCGVDLRAESIIIALIKGDYAVCRHGDNPKRRELRRLLLLKYHIEEHCVADLGAEECRRILAEEEAALRSRGFTL